MVGIRSRQYSGKALQRRLASSLETVRAAARRTTAQASRATPHSTQISNETNTALITQTGTPGSTQAVSLQQLVTIQQHRKPERE